MNNGKDDGLMSEEKVGFKAIGSWFLFPEEAISLFYLKKIIVYCLKNKNIDEIELLRNDEKSLEDKIIMISSVLELFNEIYDGKPSIYNKLHISMMYNFFKRKGNFIKRFKISND